MTKFLIAVLFTILSLPAHAFCGFYVARADGELFNDASTVVYARHAGRSYITMSSDYRGEPSEFAMIIPTPFVLREDQIRTLDASIVDHLDAYSAPRLVEYHDPDPCEPPVDFMVMASPIMESAEPERSRGPAAFGVTIEAEYAIGEYDILILGAEESDGLIGWLVQEGYNIPDGAEEAVQMYLEAGMKFFVAKVNLERHSTSDAQVLSPIQIYFRSSDFMLPIQLGMVNADSPQDLILMTLTKRGRVELTNYPTTDLPTDVGIPSFVEELFPRFYQDTFSNALGAAGTGAVLEYGWDMAWCDPCAADPLPNEDLEALGAFWIGDDDNAGQDVYVTRLHIRYDSASFPEDLMMRVTDNRDNFQGRYIMTQPWDGPLECDWADDYVADTQRRIGRDAATLHDLTGWSEDEINARLRETVQPRYWPQ